MKTTSETKELRSRKITLNKNEKEADSRKADVQVGKQLHPFES